MDTLILGLLILKSRTIYEIKTRINSGMNMMYSNSLGSIQTAIKKLLAQEYIDFVEVVENGKYKKRYSITQAGREYFNQWVNTPMRASQNKSPDLPKLYFMGLSDKETRIDRIMAYIRSLEEAYTVLNVLYEQGKTIEVDCAMKDIFDYQFLSLKYGVDSIGFEIQWYKNIADSIKKGAL